MKISDKVSESETDFDLNNDESYKEVPDKFKNYKVLFYYIFKV